MKRYLRGRMARWIRKRQGDDTLPLTLARRRLYILPTGTGVTFSVLLFLMLLAGLNYANSLALFLTFLLAGFTMVAMHQCHRNLLGTHLVSATAHPSFAGRAGRLDLTFENTAASARFRIAAELEGQPPVLVDVPAGGQRTIHLGVPTQRRGLLHIERLRLMTTHPFGLFRAWTWIHASIEILVYPQPRGVLPRPLSQGVKAGAQSVSIPGSDEWLGLRPFRDGDSPRQVDWKAYAREAPLLVKEYSAVASELRVFDFNTLTHLDTEARLEQITRWTVDAELSGERYALALPDARLPPGCGAEHRHRCLSALAMFGPKEPHA